MKEQIRIAVRVMLVVLAVGLAATLAVTGLIGAYQKRDKSMDIALSGAADGAPAERLPVADPKKSDGRTPEALPQAAEYDRYAAEGAGSSLFAASETVGADLYEEYAQELERYSRIDEELGLTDSAESTAAGSLQSSFGGGSAFGGEMPAPQDGPAEAKGAEGAAAGDAAAGGAGAEDAAAGDAATGGTGAEDAAAENAAAEDEALTAAAGAYQAWDAELNAVYQRVKASMTEKQFEQLRQEERAWIRERDQKAAADSAGYEDAEAEIRSLWSMTDSTRERSYELLRMVYLLKQQK